MSRTLTHFSCHTLSTTYFSRGISCIKSEPVSWCCWSRHSTVEIYKYLLSVDNFLGSSAHLTTEWLEGRLAFFECLANSLVYFSFFTRLNTNTAVLRVSGFGLFVCRQNSTCLVHHVLAVLAFFLDCSWFRKFTLVASVLTLLLQAVFSSTQLSLNIFDLIELIFNRFELA